MPDSAAPFSAVPTETHHAHRSKSRNPVRRQAAVRKRVDQVRRRQPLWADRRQRLRQVDADEDPGRRPRSFQWQRRHRPGRAPRQAAAGPVRVRGAARARRRADGPRRVVGDEERARRDLRQPRCQRRGLRARRGPRGAFLGIGRLHGGGARGRTVAGAGNTHGAARGTDERGGAGLEAACAARAGAVRQSGHPAARRADQPPRHQHDPLARRRDQRAQLDDGDHFPRPPLPEQRVHAHGGPGLRHAARLSGQLRRLHDRVHAGARAAAGREQQGQGSHRRTAGVRAPVLGQQGALEAGDVAHQDDREAEARRRQAFVAAKSVHPLRLRSEAEAASPRGRGRSADQGLAGHGATAVRGPVVHA